MRVAIASPNFFDARGERIIFGGGERYLWTLWKVLTEAGAQVDVFQLADEKVFKREYSGMRVTGIPSRCDFAEFSWQFNDAFNELTWSYDLHVYFIIPFAWPNVVRPAIGVSHGVWFDYPTHEVHLQSEEGRKVYLDRLRVAIHNVDRIVSCDTNTIGVFSALWPETRGKFSYVPNFVDTTQFYPRQEPRTWERPRILVPRRLTVLRGVQKVVDLIPQFPEADWLLCGRGHTNETEEQLTGFLEKNKWDNVQFFWKPMDEMPEVYRETDIALFLTPAAEGTSLAALESLASGLVTIVTPVGGLTDLILDGVNGFVVEPRAPALQETLRWVINNLWTPEMHEIRKRARLVAEKAFSLQLWRQRWFSVIREVTGVNLGG